MVLRFDKSGIAKAVKLDNGFLRAPARLTRTGVFEYLRADGSIQREYRSPEEVFDPKAMSSFALLPLVNGHPKENNGALTADNAKRLAVGSVGAPVREGEFVAAEILVTDSEMIGQIEAGKREISCGYFCDREPAPAGFKVDGEEVHFFQKNIRGNHVAIVARGRAGADACIRLDSEGNEIKPAEEAKESETKKHMDKLTVDGVDYEVSGPVAQAVAKERAAAKLALDQATARADASTAKAEKLAGDLAAATDPKALAGAVAARVEIEKIATTHEVKCDGLDNDGAKRAVIGKLNASIKLEGKSPDYVDAMFTALTLTAPAPAPKKNVIADAIAAGAAPAVIEPAKSAAEKLKSFNDAVFKTDAAKRSENA